MREYISAMNNFSVLVYVVLHLDSIKFFSQGLVFGVAGHPCVSVPGPEATQRCQDTGCQDNGMFPL